MKVVADQHEPIVPSKVVDTIDKLKRKIAEKFAAQFTLLYKTRGEYIASLKDSSCQEAKAARKLKNLSLMYLSKLGESQFEEQAKGQYRNSPNMTETLGVLQAIKNTNTSLFNELMKDFEEKWQGDSLVMDKWFAIHASINRTGCLDDVKSLMSHQSFNFDNPNRLRSLVGTFVMRNPKQFHQESGYRFLGELLARLNDSNPQIAARLITPLLSWRKYESKNQEVMQSVLKDLAELPTLSKDLEEKITKALS